MWEWAIAAGGVTTVRALDLDHVSTVIRQEFGAVGTSNIMAQVQYAEICKSGLDHDAYLSLGGGAQHVRL
jgi:hypothetical protein